MNYFPGTNLTETELSWIIDAVVSGKVSENIVFNGINPSELERILIRIGERFNIEEKQKKIESPEPWGVSLEIMNWEKSMGLPELKYFSKPKKQEKNYFGFSLIEL